MINDNGILEHSNPAAMAWYWDEQSGIEKAVTWVRDTERFTYAVKTLEGRWVEVSIDAPERFGFTPDPEGARRAALQFILGDASRA